MSGGELLGYAAVLLGGAVPWLEAVVVIPVGIVAGLSPVPVLLLAVTGNLATVALAVLAGDRLQRWWMRRRAARADAVGPQAWSPSRVGGGPVDAGARGAPAASVGAPPTEAPLVEAGSGPATGSRRGERAQRLWRRYGLPGLALLGPIVTGTQLAAFVAATAGAPRRAVLAWIAGGTVAWSLIAAVAAVIGVDLAVT